MDFLIRTVPASPSLLRLPTGRKNLRVICQSQPSSLPFSREKKKLEDLLMPNARRKKTDSVGSSLGVDLGNARTGLALGNGLAVARPLMVLEMKGQELEIRLVEVAEKEEVNELIVGIPKSIDGTENPQSIKVRGFVRKLAVRAADRGVRVYLQNEHGTSKDAVDYMFDIGIKKSSRRVNSDAYAAVMVLERYFEGSGYETELILPKQPELREKLRARLEQAKSFIDEDEPGEGIFDFSV